MYDSCASNYYNMSHCFGQMYLDRIVAFKQFKMLDVSLHNCPKEQKLSNKRYISGLNTTRAAEAA